MRILMRVLRHGWIVFLLMDLSRRGFMRGVAGAAASAVLPTPRLGVRASVASAAPIASVAAPAIASEPATATIFLSTFDTDVCKEMRGKPLSQILSIIRARANGIKRHFKGANIVVDYNCDWPRVTIETTKDMIEKAPRWIESQISYVDSGHTAHGLSDYDPKPLVDGVTEVIEGYGDYIEYGLEQGDIKPDPAGMKEFKAMMGQDDVFPDVPGVRDDQANNPEWRDRSMVDESFEWKLSAALGLIKEEEEEYPCHDKEHTQSAIGYIMKYQGAGGEIGEKAKRNKSKVAKAAHKFGVELPKDW